MTQEQQVREWMRKELNINAESYLDSALVLNATLLAETYADEFIDEVDIPEIVFDVAAEECDKQTKHKGYNS